MKTALRIHEKCYNVVRIMSTPEARNRAREAYRKRRIDADMCFQCKNPRIPKQKLCEECAVKARAYAKARYYTNHSALREKARHWARERYRKDPEKMRIYQRERYRKHPELFRGYELKQHYGITLAEFEILNTKQGGCCAICKKPPTIGKRGRAHSTKQPPHLYVDHDHATGAVRGLLCHWCNSHIIAGIEKSGASLDQIAEYLKGGS